MVTKVSINRPTGSLIHNVSQEFTGWLTLDESTGQALEFMIDGAVVSTTFYRREDVEQVLPGKRILGWTFFLDPALTYRQPHRTLELSLRLGDRSVFTQHFLKSKNLMPADRASPLFFMHIPKTAGTALRQFVDFAFSDYPSMLVYGDHPGINTPRVLGPMREFASTREIFFGHYDLSFACTLYEHDPKIVTIFRDPQQLVRSYLDSVAEPVPQFLDNPLTRHVCGLSYTEPFGLITQTHLETALRRIGRHFYVLQQDQLQQYADDVGRIFGLPDFKIPRINEANRSSKTADTQQPVDIRYDMQLYAACRNKSFNFLDFLNV